jgi:hypothetical protein
MNLQSLAYVGEIIGTVVVILSLVYLGVQVRQNTEAQRTENLLALWIGWRPFNQSSVRTAKFQLFFRRGLQTSRTLQLKKSYDSTGFCMRLLVRLSLCFMPPGKNQ